MKFTDLNLNTKLQEGIDSFNYSDATKIQELIIPEILKGKDVLACSQTGSGKTAAFLIPIIERILSINKKGTRALIITPTREICIQIEEQVAGLGYFSGTSSIPVYGGGDKETYSRQRTALLNGAEIIIATPGRLISHIGMDYLKLENLDFLVLDEADEMLDMGFYSDIINIISKIPNKHHQTLLFSATMPEPIKQLSEKILSSPFIIDINLSKPAEEIVQKSYIVFSDKKQNLLEYILKQKTYKKLIIFVSRKSNVGTVSSFLKSRHIKHLLINSSFTQEERTETIRKFKGEERSILITTNLLSRGVDIDNIDLIINYDIPDKPEDYVHRIGRTARAGKNGIAISLCNENEISDLIRIEKHINRKIEQLPLPDQFGKSPEYIAKKKKPFRKFKKKPFIKNKTDK